MNVSIGALDRSRATGLVALTGAAETASSPSARLVTEVAMGVLDLAGRFKMKAIRQFVGRFLSGGSTGELNARGDLET